MPPPESDRRRPINRPVASLVLLAALAACQPEDQRTETIDPAEARQERENLSEEVRSRLDSGSAAFRERDYERALELYREATEIDDRVAAAWFGVYMAEQALGNEEAAAAALERSRSLAPGATLIHPRPGDTLR